MNDEQHFMDCNTCGDRFDMRDLDQVVAHEHRAGKFFEATGIQGKASTDLEGDDPGPCAPDTFWRCMECKRYRPSTVAVCECGCPAASLHADQNCDYQPIADTTPSGKSLFECTACKHQSPAPTSKRCGLCPTCGYHFGTLGHTMNCTDLTDEERELLARFREGNKQ